MDNIIYLDKDYIAGVSDSFGAAPHRHPVLEVYASCSGAGHMQVGSDTACADIILVECGVTHAIADTGTRGVAVFIDPLLPLGFSLRRAYLGKTPFAGLEQPGLAGELDSLLANKAPYAGPSEGDVRKTAERILSELNPPRAERPFSDPVLETIDLLQQPGTEFDMDALADAVFLSKSRLAHLFSQQTGITLKDYLQYKRMESACRMVAQGTSITQAAMDTGFSSPSHIASASMRLTGMQLKRMLGL